MIPRSLCTIKVDIFGLERIGKEMAPVHRKGVSSKAVTRFLSSQWSSAIGSKLNEGIIERVKFTPNIFGHDRILLKV
jgi:hypothetical protein